MGTFNEKLAVKLVFVSGRPGVLKVLNLLIAYFLKTFSPVTVSVIGILKDPLDNL